MNIIYDHQIFYAQKYGGISRYFFELAKGLNRLSGVNAKVIAPFHANEYLKRLDSDFLCANYFGLDFKGASRIAGYASKAIAPLQYWINSRADIIHETYFSTQASGYGKRRVLSVYDMVHEILADTQHFSRDDSTTKKKRAAIERADHIICISESTRNDLISRFTVDAARTSVVYLGHSLATTDNLSDIFQRPDRPFLLYVGKRGGYKNFSGLLTAYAHSKKLKSELNLVAFGGGSFNASEQETLSQLGLLGKVIQVGGNDELLAHYYRHATAFVYSSLYEGFGIPPLEAMSHGCPVVCSNTSSIPEVVGNAGCYFDPHSTDSISSAIERVVFSSCVKEELVANGAARVALFSWEKCVEKTADIYRSIL